MVRSHNLDGASLDPLPIQIGKVADCPGMKLAVKPPEFRLLGGHRGQDFLVIGHVEERLRRWGRNLAVG